MSVFEEFPKIARWSRDVIITEKIDGTNAAVLVVKTGDVKAPQMLWTDGVLEVYAQSRSRLITTADDNFGFAAWVQGHAPQLAAGLGSGRHFGEWWGAGIQRRYGLDEKRFSLFNVSRWREPPPLCHVVPVLYEGPNAPGAMEAAIDLLRSTGSAAAPGFMDPEGAILFHVAGNVGFKKTLKKDEVPKALAGDTAIARAYK